MSRLNQYRFIFVISLLFITTISFAQVLELGDLSDDEKELILRYRKKKGKLEYYSVKTKNSARDTSGKEIGYLGEHEIGAEIIYDKRVGIIVKYDDFEGSYLIYFDDEDDTEWINEKDEKLIAKIDEDKIDKKERLKERSRDRLADLRDEKLDTIFGKQFFRDQNLRFFKKASEEVVPDSYLLGSGDEITISVWGYSEFEETFEISPKGYINNKYTGRVYLKGLTFSRAKKLLKSRFGRVFDLKRSGFDVMLSYSRTIGVNIVGEVIRPGTYEIPAINTAFNALMAAEGIGELGSIRRILIIRDDKIVDSLDVYQFLVDPVKQKQIFLQDNDYIFVPVREELVKLEGEVKRPMYYELKKDESVNELIRYAGGYTPKANRNSVTVVGYRGNRKLLSGIDLTNETEVSKFRFKDGDVVTILPIIDRVDNAVSVSGAVHFPGDYEYKPNMRLKDLINKAQGLKEEAYLLRANLYREVDDYTDTLFEINLLSFILENDSLSDIKLQPRDRLIVLSRKDFVDSFSVVVYGAVRKPDTFVYGKGMTLKDALLLAGGLIDNISNNKIEISRIYRGGDKSDMDENAKVLIQTVTVDKVFGIDNDAVKFKLQPFDQIFVRTRADFEFQRNVQIRGEINYPGFYSLIRSDERITDIIERAGGLTPVAFLDGCNLYRNYDSARMVSVNLEKALSNKDSRYNIILRDGDSIFIVKKNELVRIKGNLRNTLYHDLSVPFTKKKSAKYYVNHFAGGYLDDNDKRNTFVVLPNQGIRGTRNLLFIRKYPKVVPGSTILVPRDKEEIEEFVVRFKTEVAKDEEKIEWSEVINSTMATITSILSVILLVESLKN